MEKDIKDVFIEEIKDLYSAEHQIVVALPEMAIAAESSELKEAFKNHLQETRGQIHRLEQVFKLLKMKPEEKFCKAAKGLIEECKETIKGFKKSYVRDAALISKAQRFEHYEIAAYGSARTFAKELGLSEIASLLKETLDQEANADKLLTKIAQGGLFSAGVNRKANLMTESLKKVSPAKKSETKITKPAPKAAAHKAPAKPQAKATPKKKATASR